MLFMCAKYYEESGNIHNVSSCEISTKLILSDQNALCVNC